MASGKRFLALMSVVAILGTAGYALAKASPYNNKNITFINRNLDNFSREMDNFIKNDFNNFNEIMYDLQNGNYDKLTYIDINNLDKYINTLLTCNFKGYEADDMWRYRNREQSGFVIEFENYFPIGSEERTIIEKFSGYYEKIISDGYRYIVFDVEKMVEACTMDYHAYKHQINNLPAFSKYIVLKLIRPIIAANDSQYVTRNCFYYRDKTLAEIDAEISRSRWTIEKQCANPDVNYNVSRR